MASVKLTNVRKIYGKDTVAVEDFSLDIADKEFIVFVGPSGCGKSTTLRMIAGLEDISSGTVEIDGVVVNDLEPRERDIAMVFQNYALYPHLTVFENMAFSLRLRKRPQEEVYAKVTAAAQILGITEYLARKKHYGKSRLRLTLLQKFDRESFDEYFSEAIEEIDFLENAKLEAERIASRGKRYVLSRLQALGYSSHEIYEALDGLQLESECFDS